MATRSLIGYRDPIKNTYSFTYCHFNGDPTTNGRILLESYNDFDKVSTLVLKGDIRILSNKIDRTQYYDDKTETSLLDRSTLEEILQYFKNDPMLSYLYLYTSSGWRFMRNKGGMTELTKDLTE